MIFRPYFVIVDHIQARLLVSISLLYEQHSETDGLFHVALDSFEQLPNAFPDSEGKAGCFRATSASNLHTAEEPNALTRWYLCLWISKTLACPSAGWK